MCQAHCKCPRLAELKCELPAGSLSLLDVYSSKTGLLQLLFNSSSVEGAFFLCFQSLLNVLTLASIKVLPHLDGPYDCTGVVHIYQTLNTVFVSTVSFHQTSLNEKTWVHQSIPCLMQTTVIIVINIHCSTCYSKILKHICRKI